MKRTQRFLKPLQTDNQFDEPRLEDTGRGLTCLYKGRYLYSRRDPSASSEKIVSAAEFNPETLIIIPSPVLGYGISQILNKLPPTSFILAIETDQSLMSLSVNHIPDSILKNPQFMLIRTQDTAGVMITIKNIGLYKYRRTLFFPLSQSYTLDQAGYTTLYGFVQTTIKNFWSNRITSVKLGRLWINNFIRNLPHLHKAKDLSIFKSNKPVLLCGAGESLESVISIIKDNRSRYFLLSVDTAMPTLIRNGITPDAVLVLEAQYWNILDFYHSIDKGIPIIADVTAYPHSLDLMRGPVYFFITEFSELSFLKRFYTSKAAPVRLPPMGSVGVAGLHIARMISSGNPIAVAGLDFAYRRGKSHCRGSMTHDLYLTKQDRLHPDYLYPFLLKKELQKVPGKKYIVTDSGMAFYAALFSERIPDHQVFRITDEYYPLNLPYTDDISQLRDTQISKSTNEIAQGFMDSSYIFSFIKNEIKLLDRIIDSWERYEKDNNSNELIRNLTEGDYLTFHFPDKLPHPRTETTFLFHAVTEARKKRILFRKALSEIETTGN